MADALRVAESGDSLRLALITLLVCDAAGRVQAIASGSSTSSLLQGSELTPRHYSEVFGRDSGLTNWLTERMAEARKAEAYCMEARVDSGGSKLLVGVESLFSGRDFYGVAVHVLNDADRGDSSLGDGDSVITRQQWHDIKNHLGGLKLYATFLLRKLPTGDDQQTVEKLLNGIDGLIENLARIRRGEGH